jgi:hypothetical protein
MKVGLRRLLILCFIFFIALYFLWAVRRDGIILRDVARLRGIGTATIGRQYVQTKALSTKHTAGYFYVN